jgi:hypothetical protein
MEVGLGSAGIATTYVRRPKCGADSDQSEVEDETSRNTEDIDKPPRQVSTEMPNNPIFDAINDVVTVCLT